MAADKIKKSSKIPDKHLIHEDGPKSSDGEVIMPATPLRPTRLAGESQGGNIITLAMRTPERRSLKSDLTLRITSPEEIESIWQLPASTAPPSLGQTEAG